MQKCFQNIEAGGDSDLDGLNDHNKNELESGLAGCNDEEEEEIWDKCS
jgi:hypothetical protein